MSGEDADDRTTGGALDVDADAILLHAESRYAAYGKDLEYMWRWEVLRDGEFVQEGCSLSENSAREAVSYVIGFYQRQDIVRETRPGEIEEIQRLLTEAGLGTPRVIEPERSQPSDDRI